MELFSFLSSGSPILGYTNPNKPEFHTKHPNFYEPEPELKSSEHLYSVPVLLKDENF